MILVSFAIILLWGVWGCAGKLALEHHMSPIALFLTEALCGFLCALVVILAMTLRQDTLPWKQPVNLYGFLSGISLAIGLLLYCWTMQKGTVTVVVPLTSIYPVASILLSRMFLGEKPTTWQWVGLVLAVAGAALLVSAENAVQE